MRQTCRLLPVLQHLRTSSLHFSNGCRFTMCQWFVHCSSHWKYTHCVSCRQPTRRWCSSGYTMFLAKTPHGMGACKCILVDDIFSTPHNCTSYSDIYNVDRKLLLNLTNNDNLWGAIFRINTTIIKCAFQFSQRMSTMLCFLPISCRLRTCKAIVYPLLVSDYNLINDISYVYITLQIYNVYKLLLKVQAHKYNVGHNWKHTLNVLEQLLYCRHIRPGASHVQCGAFS